MTMETFERAIEIKSQIDTLYSVQDVLANSNCDNNSYLAAIKAKKLSQSGIVVEDCEVWNHVRIPKNVMKRFEEVLWEEIGKLNKEFDKL